MCIYGYIDICVGEIIFASPKINPAVRLELEPKIQEINNLFEELGIGFWNRLIANEEFNGKVLKPILLASDGISDTSELFLRGFQMYSMFSDEVRVDRNIRKVEAEVPIIPSTLSYETLKELKIGRLVQTTMKKMFDEERITNDEIEQMLLKDYSKKVFNSNIPVLIEVPDNGDLKKLGKDENNYSRYYAYTISIYGKRYLLSSQWVEYLHRSYYEKWLTDKI